MMMSTDDKVETEKNHPQSEPLCNLAALLDQLGSREGAEALVHLRPLNLRDP